MQHGDIAWVKVDDDREAVLARYTHYEDCDPYWAFFGTEYTLRPDQLVVVRQTDLRSE